jgi:hypothetical protein
MLMTISMHSVVLYTVVGFTTVAGAGRLLVGWALEDS